MIENVAAGWLNLPKLKLRPQQPQLLASTLRRARACCMKCMKWMNYILWRLSWFILFYIYCVPCCSALVFPTLPTVQCPPGPLQAWAGHSNASWSLTLWVGWCERRDISSRQHVLGRVSDGYVSTAKSDDPRPPRPNFGWVETTNRTRMVPEQPTKFLSEQPALCQEVMDEGTSKAVKFREHVVNMRGWATSAYFSYIALYVSLYLLSIMQACQRNELANLQPSWTSCKMLRNLQDLFFTSEALISLIGWILQLLRIDHWQPPMPLPFFQSMWIQHFRSFLWHPVVFESQSSTVVIGTMADK